MLPNIGSLMLTTVNLFRKLDRWVMQYTDIDVNILCSLVIPRILPFSCVAHWLNLRLCWLVYNQTERLWQLSAVNQWLAVLPYHQLSQFNNQFNYTHACPHIPHKRRWILVGGKNVTLSLYAIRDYYFYIQCWVGTFLFLLIEITSWFPTPDTKCRLWPSSGL